MLIEKISRRLRFLFQRQRIGFDTILSLALYSPSLFRLIYKKQFFSLADTAVIRLGAQLVNLKKISLGRNVVIRSGSYIFASSQDFLDEEIILEDDVLIGSGVHIYTNNHRFNDTSLPISEQGFDTPRKVILEKGCWIGAQAIILPGVTIGRNSVVAAGSVVTKSIPPYTVAGGNPAKVIKEMRKS